MQFLTLERSLETHAAEEFLSVKQWRYASHALAFQIDADRRDRLAALDFDPSRLSREYFTACDLCGWKVFRTVSRMDRYGFPGTYQICEGCGLVFQNPHPTARAYAEFYQKWYRPLVTAYWGEAIDVQTTQADQDRYAEWLVNFLKPPHQKSGRDRGRSWWKHGIEQRIRSMFA